MKNTLKALVAWLDRKFPDKIMVTVDDFNQFMKRLEALETSKIDENRLKSMESEINKFNMVLGLGNVNKSPIPFQPYQR